MECSANLHLRTDPHIAGSPQGPGLIEYVLRSAEDHLEKATSEIDFCERLASGLFPFRQDFGPLGIRLVNPEGLPADLLLDNHAVLVVYVDQPLQ